MAGRAARRVGVSGEYGGRTGDAERELEIEFVRGFEGDWE